MKKLQKNGNGKFDYNMARILKKNVCMIQGLLISI